MKLVSLPIRKRGFTIVELVVVIVLIGILAATALPHFMNAKDDARISAARKSTGSFLEAVNLMHGQWLADGTNATSLVVGGVTLQFNNNGWPKSQVSNTADCIDVWNGVFHAPDPAVPYVANAPQDAWSVLGFATGCLYVYQYGEIFSVANQLPFFVYIPEVTHVRILPFNM